MIAFIPHPHKDLASQVLAEHRRWQTDIGYLMGVLDRPRPRAAVQAAGWDEAQADLSELETRRISA